MDNTATNNDFVRPDADANAVALPPVLYRLKGAHRQDVWALARLVPHKEYETLQRDALTSAHAKSAFCLICRASIPFRVGQSASVRSHMEQLHAEKLRDVNRQRQAAQDGGREAHTSSDDSTTHRQGRKKRKVELSDNEQKRSNHLLASWLAKNSRPIALVEDDGFREYVSFVAGVGGVTLKIPRRTEVRSEVVRIAAEMRESLKLRLQGEADFYSITTDTWTDRAQRSYLALTMHYLTQDFKPRNWTLEVEHFPGIHTADSLAAAVRVAMDRWGLRSEKCAVLLRDGAANAVSATHKLNVFNISCIAHSLHLVVAGAMITRKERATAAREPSTVDANVEHDICDDEDEDEIVAESICDEIEDFVQTTVEEREQTAMSSVRRTVAAFRRIAVYFRKSAKGKYRLLRLQERSGVKSPVGTITDCPTRWNSTREMLLRLVTLEPVIKQFFGYLRTSEGRVEFPHMKLQLPTAEQWLVARGLLKLLDPFVYATQSLSGESYPTMALAIPFLRATQIELEKEDMFDEIAGSAGDEVGVDRVVTVLQTVRVAFVRLFLRRFASTLGALKWISFLDPRVSVSTYLSVADVRDARRQLLAAAVEMGNAMESVAEVRECEALDDSPTRTPTKARASMLATVFGSRAARPPEPGEITGAARELSTRCEAQILLYLDESSTASHRSNPLEWWFANGKRFPVLASLARKWLGCVATSVPSERAFSTGGITVSPRRCGLTPGFVRDLVFIAENPTLL